VTIDESSTSAEDIVDYQTHIAALRDKLL
jgi:hypothetical protein